MIPVVEVEVEVEVEIEIEACSLTESGAGVFVGARLRAMGWPGWFAVRFAAEASMLNAGAVGRFLSPDKASNRP